MEINKILSEEFKINQKNIDNVIDLINDGKTIPFIARYRKELTGSLDDQVLREIYDRMTYLNNLQTRKNEVISLITEQEKMTDEIAEKIENAMTLVEVEDIYRPFKQKRKTRPLKKTRLSFCRFKTNELMFEVLKIWLKNMQRL